MERHFDREIQFMEDFPVMICIGDVKKDCIVSLNAEGRGIIGENYQNQSLFEVFGSASEYNAYMNQSIENQKKKTTYGQLIFGRWVMVSICRFQPENEDFKNLYVITGVDVTSLKRHGYFDSVAERDGLTGIYNMQSGIHFLENLLYALDASEDRFTLSYIRFDGANVDVSDIKAYTLGLVDVIKNAIRGTDIFAAMAEYDFLLIFPKCSFDIVEHIMSTIDNKLNLINNTDNLPYDYVINYGILEIDHTNTNDREAILNRLKAML